LTKRSREDRMMRNCGLHEEMLRLLSHSVECNLVLLLEYHGNRIHTIAVGTSWKMLDRRTYGWVGCMLFIMVRSLRFWTLFNWDSVTVSGWCEYIGRLVYAHLG
jgi:hypothetical protein